MKHIHNWSRKDDLWLLVGRATANNNYDMGAIKYEKAPKEPDQ
jgi:hypothetical protein